MTSISDTRFWHPFADMSSVRSSEFVIERGEDVWVWDAQGNRYLDATASLWYANVGHGRLPRHQRLRNRAGQIGRAHV